MKNMLELPAEILAKSSVKLFWDKLNFTAYKEKATKFQQFLDDENLVSRGIPMKCLMEGQLVSKNLQFYLQNWKIIPFFVPDQAKICFSNLIIGTLHSRRLANNSS